MTEIERRILDAVVKMVRERKWQPKVLYLDAEDHQAWLRARWGHDLHEVGGIAVRQGKWSRLYADHGYSSVSLPKPRVAAA
jgi:hypothetical protein